MPITASDLRQNVYRILDEALTTGRSVEVVRRGRRLRIIPDTGEDRLANLPREEIIVGDFDEIVHMDWSQHWKPDDNLP